MEIWIPLTLLAALSQGVRSALQKHLTGSLSTLGATHARFLYAFPCAIAYLVLLRFGFGYEMPAPNGRFVGFALTGGAAQIAATALLVMLYSRRNFLVGTALSKTETIQVAVLGVLVLSDRLTAGAVTGVVIGVGGVIVISVARGHPTPAGLARSLRSSNSIIGILIGLLFAVAAIGFRGASLSLEGGVAIQAAATLGLVLVFQSLAMTIWLLWREPGQMMALFAQWRVASVVGFSGMLASAAWFTAMTLQNAAYVKALGQIELVFAFLASWIFFGEQSNRAEIAGVFLIVIGILVLLLFGQG